MKKTWILIGAIIVLCLNVSAQNCGINYTEVIVKITADNYPQETHWEITKGDSVLYAGVIEPSETVTRDTFCVRNDTCLLFTIYDAANDGICCAGGFGKYEIYMDGVREIRGGYFKSYASHNLLCATGTVCEAAMPADTGANFLAFDNNWYLFEPDTTGRYELSTCGQGNECQAAVWIYDYCIGLTWDETVVSSIGYSSSGCPGEEGGALSATLEKGKSYYIRIGDKNDDCAGVTSWSLKYEGPVVGCLDPASCTYNPLATVGDVSMCFYSPSDSCPSEQPDLSLDGDTLRESLFLDFVVNNDVCLRSEGCLSGYGTREVLRFTTKIDNIGNADFIAGQVPDFIDQESEKFEWDQCHQHWHYQGYANYLVFNSAGEQLPLGFKNGFCVLDLYCSSGTPKYGCNNMGISAGCTDVYDYSYTCQWIDITGLEPGEYALVAQVNYDRKPDITGKQETTYDNNSVRICFELFRDGTGLPSIEILEECDAITDCLGVPNGEAIRDCKGVCNGGNLHGDVNGNQQIESTDVDFYMDHILNDPFLPVEPCFDLNADGVINVLDMALLSGCKKQTESGGPINPNQDRCSFPSNIFNPNDSIELKLSALNNEFNYVEVSIKNPLALVQGIEFNIEGISISSIVNLSTASLNIEFNDEGKVVLSPINADQPLLKNADFSPLVRLYYDNEDLSYITACLDQNDLYAMNGLFEEMTGRADSNCLRYVSSDVFKNTMKSFQIAPNPTQNKVIIQSNLSESSQEINLSIMDLNGRLLSSKAALLGEEVDFGYLNLAEGTYLFKITSVAGSYFEKINILRASN